MTAVLAIAVVVAQLLDLATWLAMPRVAEANPIALGLHTTTAFVLKGLLLVLVLGIQPALRPRYRAVGELVALVAIAAGCIGAGSNLAAITYVAAAEAPRPALLAIPADARAASDELPKDADLSSRTDAGRTPAPRSVPRGTLRGVASWYAAPRSVAAAGPALRRALGPRWRGSWVRVVAGDRSVTVKLVDWCQCYGVRLVDLSDDDFAVLAPLAAGVVRVRIAIVLPPATDTP
jgi:hypothetical protein